METKHTPTPWSLEIETEEGGTDENPIVIGIRITIPEIFRCFHDYNWADTADWDIDLANAKFLVRAVNAHEALVEALEKVALFGENINSLSIGTEAALTELARNARAALKLAKGD